MPLLIWSLVIGLTLYCLIDVALSDPQEVRSLPKTGWLLIVLFFPGFGALAWLFAGRPARTGGAEHQQGQRPGGVSASRQRPAPRGERTEQPPTRSRPRGPDDDPEFLRRLEEELRRGRRGEGGEN